MPRWTLLAGSLGLTGLLLACAGELFDSGPHCGAIPQGGCPAPRDDVDYCQDRTCDALYRCVGLGDEAHTGEWQPLKSCPEREPTGDAGVDAEADAAPDADADTEPRDPTKIPDDLPAGAAGGAGCVSLQLPECALSAGYGCVRNCCECEDMFVCVKGGWELWGHCVDHLPTPAR